MSVSVAQMDKSQISRLISTEKQVMLTDHEQLVLDNCLMMTSHLWAGFYDGDFVCTWGLIPPTLMSNSAYLWLYTTELGRHEFLFVRHSQRIVEQMLKEYPTIVGHTHIDRQKAIRWLQWLGAEFGPCEGRLVPFVIRKR